MLNSQKLCILELPVGLHIVFVQGLHIVFVQGLHIVYVQGFAPDLISP